MDTPLKRSTDGKNKIRGNMGIGWMGLIINPLRYPSKIIPVFRICSRNKGTRLLSGIEQVLTIPEEGNFVVSQIRVYQRIGRTRSSAVNPGTFIFIITTLRISSYPGRPMPCVIHCIGSSSFQVGKSNFS